MKKILLLLTIGFMLISCRQNQRAKSFGGNATIELPKGTKLIEATWKGEYLWYLTRTRREGEPIETYEFIEDSSFGVMEGTVIFIER
jgi:hypothetical protein